MLLRVTTAMNKVTKARFQALLLSGAFPKVDYHKGDNWEQFSLFEYSNTHARYMKLVDKKMKVELDPYYGVFTRKHSKDFLEKVAELVNEITETDVLNFNDRFHSFADDVMAEAMK